MWYTLLCMTYTVSGTTGLRAARGPVVPHERALAPDLARGVMLLPIALANATGVIFGGSGFEPAPEGFDRLLNLFMGTFVHARAYPVFAVMFGYGLVQLACRQAAAGASRSALRTILVRRSIGLLVLGLIHACLLYFGDFLAAYGLMGILAAFLLLPFERLVHRVTLFYWVVSVLYVITLAAVAAFRWIYGSNRWTDVPLATVNSLVARDYYSSMLARLSEWPVHTATVVPAIGVVMLGMLAARHQLLEHPAKHRFLLTGVAATGLGIAFVGGLPFALVRAGMLHADSAAISAILRLHEASGIFGGPGYAALAGLAALWLQPASGNSLARASTAISALGQRSLSGYLAQSVAWVLLLSPYTLALGERFQSPMLTAIVVAQLVWIASLLGASLMDRRHYRGPAEIVLRRFVYPGRV